MNKSVKKAPPYSFLKKAAIHAAHTAGERLLKNFRKKIQIRQKLDLSLVTNADLESEKAILKILKSATPDFTFVSEESFPLRTLPAHSGEPQGRWVIDPLDGTTNFAHGSPHFCVSIAAQWSGQTLLGVIYHPFMKDTFYACLGKGAFLNGKKIKVSENKGLKSSLLATGFSDKKNLHQEMLYFEKLSQMTQSIRRPGAAALDLAWVAQGVFDGFWEKGLACWDVAAGNLLVQEAGGKVTSFSGKAFDFSVPEVIASNGKIHSQLIKVFPKN